MIIKQPKVIITVVSIVVIGLISFYLYQVGDLTRSSYLITNYQSSTNDTVADNSNLIDGSFDTLSLNTSESRAVGYGFVKVEKVSYIPITASLLTVVGP